jgi:mRNA interferase HigB
LRIISKKKLREFWEEHPDAMGPLREWYNITEQAIWGNFAEVRNSFRHADSYCDCVIYDVKGNDYRLIAIVLYQVQRVYVRHVLTHKDGFVARIRVKGCGRDQVVSFSCDEKENRLPHPQLERV